MNVTLTKEQWADVMALLEKGICSIGFPAFEPGAKLMSEIKQQLDEQVTGD